MTGKEQQLFKQKVESLAASLAGTPLLSPGISMLESMADLEDFIAGLDPRDVPDDFKLAPLTCRSVTLL